MNLHDKEIVGFLYKKNDLKLQYEIEHSVNP